MGAFEPLPANAALLAASAALNGVAADVGVARPAPGAVFLHQHALGDELGAGVLFEGRGNAGMSVLAPDGPRGHCDKRAFLCGRELPVDTVPLDELVGAEDGPICLAKLDVEGSELRVLRGALTLLR